MKKLLYKSVFFSLAVMGLCACSNIVEYDKDYVPAHEIENQGAPVIDAIYDVADVDELHPLKEGKVNMMIRIVGKNLNKVQSVRFVTADPDLSGEADLSEAYTYFTAANVTIPASIGQKVTKVEYTTDKGTVSFPFIVDFPELEINQNQYMLQGERITIYGRYFDKYKTVKAFADETELQVVSANETEMALQLPAGYMGDITIKWQDGDGVSQSRNIKMRPAENLLYGDFSGTSFGADGIDYTIEDDTAVPAASALGGKHLHITANLGAWAWKTLDMSQNMPFQVDSPEDYMFVFEVLTPEDSPLISSDAGSELILYQFNWDAMINWAPGAGAGLNTHGQWMTISLPLDGMAISQKDTWQTIRMVLHPNAEFNANFRLANFRILKK